MTPEMKAKELIDKFTFEIGKFNAKQCALICCDEILESEKTAYPNQHIETGQVFKEFWQSVKSEISKL